MNAQLQRDAPAIADTYSVRGLLADIADDLRFYGGRTLAGRLLAICCDLRFRLMLSYRVARHLGRGTGRHRWLQKFIAFRQQTRGGNQISPNAHLGRRLILPHPIGIVIGAGVTVEDAVTLYQHVTLGSHGRGDAERGYPVLRTGSKLYVGACALGAVTIGEGATVGANSVVLDNVRAGATVAGAPARPVG